MKPYNHILRALLLTVLTVLVSGLSAQNIDWLERYKLSRTLFEHERWVAASREIDRTTAVLPPQQMDAAVELEYMKTVCNVHRGDPSSLALLETMLAKYPNSIYNNNLRFLAGAVEYNKGNYEQALNYLLAVNPFDLNPNSLDEYNFKTGHCQFVSGDYRAAAVCLRQVSSESEFAPHAKYYLGYIAYSDGDYATARDDFKALESNKIYAPIIPFYLLQIEFLDGNYEYVVKNGDALINKSSGSRRMDLNRIMGESWFHMGDYAKTLTYMNAYRDAGGDMGRSENYVTGFADYKRANFKSAAAELSKVCGPEDELSQNASYHLGDCYLQLHQKTLAMQSFSIAASKNYNPTISEDALFNYGKLQYESGGGRFNEAINVLNRYLTLYPDSPRVPEVREFLIAAYYNAHNYKAAYEAIMQYPDPDNNIKAAMQKITYFRGLECYNDGDVNQAEQMFRTSEQYRYNAKYTALSSFWLGEILYSKSNFSAAIPKYQAYLKVSPLSEPENPLARYSLGYCQFNLERWSDASLNFAEFLSRYKTQDRYRADAFNRMGDISHMQKDYPKAVENYDSAIAIGTPQQYYAAYQRAMMFGLEGSAARKIDGLKNIISVNKGDYVSSAMYELGRTYISQDRFSDGARTMIEYAEKFPTGDKYSDALSNAGLAYLNLGDNASAMKYYKKVIETAPKSSEANDALSAIRSIYVDTNDVDGYFAYAKSTGLETDLGELQRDSLKFTAAEKVYMSGNAERAITALQGYLGSFPNGTHLPDVLYYLGDCRAKTGNTSEAINEFSRLANLKRNDFTVRGLERLSDLSYKAGRYADAADAYRKLSRVQSSPAKVSAAIDGYVNSVTATRDTVRILAMTDELSASGNVSRNAERKMMYAKASILRARGEIKLANDIYAELAEDVMTAEGAEAQYRLIENMYNEGQYADAQKAVFAFSEKNTSQMYWVGRSFLLLGDIYANQGDSFQARATYQSIIDGYTPDDDGVIAAARERIKKLK